MENEASPNPPVPSVARKNHFRFHEKHRHLAPVFGGDWFALKAEAFARFFGTPLFLVGQTIIVSTAKTSRRSANNARHSPPGNPRNCWS